MADTSYILIDAATGSPVPLPFHTTDADGELCTITDAAYRGAPMVHLTGDGDYPNGWYHIDLVSGLALITEAEYVGRQQSAEYPADHEVDFHYHRLGRD